MPDHPLDGTFSEHRQPFVMPDEVGVRRGPQPPPGYETWTAAERKAWAEYRDTVGRTDQDTPPFPEAGPPAPRGTLARSDVDIE